MPAAVDSPKVEEYLGIDVGAAKVGVARGSGAARLAEPLTTLAADVAVNQLKQLAGQGSVKAIVVGLPRGLSGDDTPQTKIVRQWVKAAQADIKLPFYWQDEALTSRQAESAAPHTAGSDAVAAAIILQDFLDSPESDRVTI